MERCWKRIQVPKGFTIWMWIVLALVGVIAVVGGVLFYIVATPSTSHAAIFGWVALGVSLLLVGLTCLAVVIVWIIFTLKKIYAPIGSTVNYGEKQPLNHKYKTYTYSTWFYVFGMVVFLLTALSLIIFGIVLAPSSNSKGLIFLSFLILIGLMSVGLWAWFIVYQTRLLHKNKSIV